jgi:uncharacterized protein YbjT (DUF2867 family)
MEQKTILVTGATGKQGKATIEALLRSSSPFRILALTRNASTLTAQLLSRKRHVTVVQGSPTNPAPIFESYQNIHGVFLNTISSTPGEEEVQGNAMINESIKNGVKLFVFSSVDRGGPAISENNPTEVEHYASKHRIERHLKGNAAGLGMGWTILRPVAFMDNFTPDVRGKGVLSMWEGLGDKGLQLISTHNIGVLQSGR